MRITLRGAHSVPRSRVPQYVSTMKTMSAHLRWDWRHRLWATAAMSAMLFSPSSWAGATTPHHHHHHHLLGPVIENRTHHQPRVHHHVVARVALAPSFPRAELIDDPSGRYNANFALDARTTNTLDWSCIRNAESHDHYHQPTGAYGLMYSTWWMLGYTGIPGEAPVWLQDRAALRLFAMNGDHFSGSWNDVCTMQEGLR